MKSMKLLVLFLVMHVVNINAMDRLLAKRYEKKPRNHRSNKIVLVPTKSENQVKEIVLHKKDLVCYQHKGTFYPTFPKEIDKNILGLVITNTGQTLQESAQIFSALICVNKFTWMHMDDDQRTLGWIKDLSKRFDCTNIDVAKALRTRAGNNRLALQLALELNWSLKYSSINLDIEKNQIALKKRGLDVNFSYDKQFPSPLLQCFIYLSESTGAAYWLIDNGADINICTHEGRNACMLAILEKYMFFLNKYLKHENLKVNHQDIFGETILHLYLRTLKDSTESPGSVICDTITEILARGANPTLANSNGETPLTIAHMIGWDFIRKPAVELLEQAAIKFNSQKNSDQSK